MPLSQMKKVLAVLLLLAALLDRATCSSTIVKVPPIKPGVVNQTIVVNVPPTVDVKRTEQRANDTSAQLIMAPELSSGSDCLLSDCDENDVGCDGLQPCGPYCPAEACSRINCLQCWRTGFRGPCCSSCCSQYMSNMYSQQALTAPQQRQQTEFFTYSQSQAIPQIRPLPIPQQQLIPIPQPQPIPITISQPIPIAQPQPIPIPQQQAIPIPQPIPQPQLIPIPQLQPMPIPQPQFIPIPQPQPMPIPQPQPIPIPQPQLIPIPQPQPIPIPQPQLIPIPQPQPMPIPQTQPIAIPQLQPIPVPQPQPIPIPQPRPVAIPISVPQPYVVPQPIPYPQPQPQLQAQAQLQQVLSPQSLTYYGSSQCRQIPWWPFLQCPQPNCLPWYQPGCIQQPQRPNLCYTVGTC